MKHAEDTAERLVCLGGTSTTKPQPIFVGDDENIKGTMMSIIMRKFLHKVIFSFLAGHKKSKFGKWAGIYEAVDGKPTVCLCREGHCEGFVNEPEEIDFLLDRIK